MTIITLVVCYFVVFMNSYQIKRYFKYFLLLFALAIGVLSLWYTNQLVESLEEEERQKAEIWANATEQLASTQCVEDIDFLLSVVQANTTIPVILTDNNDLVINYRNIDTSSYLNNEDMSSLIEEMAEQNDPIVVNYVDDEKIKIYYLNSIILTKLKYYPYFQLGVIGIFLVISYFAFSYSRRSEQNQVWVGMSKETAHQLGTPISSLMAWVGILEDPDADVKAFLPELKKDLGRLQLITERFSKIGSEPDRHPYSVSEVLNETVNYLKSRSSSRVIFHLNLKEDYQILMNPALFAWVIENLTKNAIDAMGGEGEIHYNMYLKDQNVAIEVKDTGKGIPSSDFKSVFKPGFTTKKRGWGLGLSLVKRIIHNYHEGQIYVKESTLGKGTTFKILIKRHK